MANFERDDTFLARWLDGELTEAERVAFEQSDDYETYVAIAEQARELTPKPYDKAAAWAKLDANTPAKREASVRKIGIWRAVAAAAVLLISAPAWYWTGNQTVETLAGQQELVTLPDGSTVLLNAQSELSYNGRLWSWGRSLELKGEAFFDVERGTDFVVHTQQGQVEVLGTSFNVYTRADDFEVHCTSGRVGVRNKLKAATQLVLEPNDAVSYRDSVATLETFGDDERPSWQTGENRYRSAPISRVIQDLSAQFGLTFEGDFIDREQPFTGVFLHADVDQALDMVFAPMGIAYERDGRRVRLR
ncbi:MAG: FecR domain-containing protein [Bacteroidota bacterium]